MYVAVHEPKFYVTIILADKTYESHTHTHTKTNKLNPFRAAHIVSLEKLVQAIVVPGLFVSAGCHSSL